jgi:hypothetical protein
LNQGDAMRVMAEKYLSLAKTTSDPQARRKFLGYAAVYAELSEQSVRRATSGAAEDKERNP